MEDEESLLATVLNERRQQRLRPLPLIWKGPAL
jgi:hypothetical protein